MEVILNTITYDTERKERLLKETHCLSEKLGVRLQRELNTSYSMFSKADKDKLMSMFEKCFHNTVETTVECINEDEIFIITGDIEAMWLRDSSAQVAHYLPYADRYPELAKMIKALITKQFTFIAIDPYANAFNIEPNGKCWAKDRTDDNPWNWERKYEIDSLCYPIRLLYDYWKMTGDSSVFTEEIRETLKLIASLWKTEQRHDTDSNYYFERDNCLPMDTLSKGGKGEPTAYTGMLWSGFRPSDDACRYGYLIPANMFAAVVLGYVTEIADTIYKDGELSKSVQILKNQIEEGLAKYATLRNEQCGTMYAYETDGFGNYNLMDDANVPSLLSLPWLRYCSTTSEIYQNTRRFVLSKQNPYYYEGTAAKGIGSPHTPPQYIWHIALSMQGLTAQTQEEKLEVLRSLMNTDADTGFMHEGFHCDNPKEYTRDWFAWSNSLFALFVIEFFKLI
jgi:meiotically up-regulated gene 157 (Mug157) protein